MYYYLIKNTRATSDPGIELGIQKISKEEYERAAKRCIYKPNQNAIIYALEKKNVKWKVLSGFDFIFFLKKVTTPVKTGKIYFKSKDNYETSKYYIDSGALTGAFSKFNPELKEDNTKIRKDLIEKVLEIKKRIELLDFDFNEFKERYEKTKGSLLVDYTSFYESLSDAEKLLIEVKK